VEVLDQLPGEARAEWDPFYELDDKFYELLGYQNERFAKAADEYASKISD
jgi:hypothetical protein